VRFSSLVRHGAARDATPVRSGAQRDYPVSRANRKVIHVLYSRYRTPEPCPRYPPLEDSERDFVFKSAEEREAERRERETAEAREQAARAEQARVAAEQRKRDAFTETPIGAATLAKEAGQAFFEVQLEVGGHTGSAGSGSTDGRRLSGLGARG